MSDAELRTLERAVKLREPGAIRRLNAWRDRTDPPMAEFHAGLERLVELVTRDTRDWYDATPISCPATLEPARFALGMVTLWNYSTRGIFNAQIGMRFNPATPLVPVFLAARLPDGLICVSAAIVEHRIRSGAELADAAWDEFVGDANPRHPNYGRGVQRFCSRTPVLAEAPARLQRVRAPIEVAERWLEAKRWQT